MRKLYILSAVTAALLFTQVSGQVNSKMAGSFQQHDSCQGYSHALVSTIFIVASVANHTDITIKNFSDFLPYYNANVVMDSTNGTVLLPLQNTGSATVQGSGIYTANYDSLILNFVIMDTPVINCTEIYTRTGLGINELHNQVKIETWPNPVTTAIHFKIDSYAPQGEIKVLNVYGQCVYMRSINMADYTTEQTIDMQPFASGIYVLQLENGQGISNAKFIKQ